MRQLTIAGRLGRDAELKTLGSGKDVINFAVAVDVYRAGSKETLWVDCALYGERAAKLQPYLTKGKSVTVSGDVSVRAYMKKDGTAAATLGCDVQRLTLQGGREAETSNVTNPAWGPAAKPARPAPPAEENLDDEIPF